MKLVVILLGPLLIRILFYKGFANNSKIINNQQHFLWFSQTQIQWTFFIGLQSEKWQIVWHLCLNISIFLKSWLLTTTLRAFVSISIFYNVTFVFCRRWVTLFVRLALSLYIRNAFSFSTREKKWFNFGLMSFAISIFIALDKKKRKKRKWSNITTRIGILVRNTFSHVKVLVKSLINDKINDFQHLTLITTFYDDNVKTFPNFDNDFQRKIFGKKMKWIFLSPTHRGRSVEVTLTCCIWVVHHQKNKNGL